MTIQAEELIKGMERQGRPVPEELRPTRQQARPAARPRRGLGYLTLLDAVSAAIGRSDDEHGDAMLAAEQAFAYAWAGLGYALWVVAVITFRVARAAVMLVARAVRR